MAKVPLNLIGASLDEILSTVERKQHTAEHGEKRALLEERREEVRSGWGPKYVERVHEKGKLTTRERIELLKDEDSPFYELGTFVNYAEEFGKLKSPAAGVVTGFARVEQRWCVVIANDNTVASGAWWPRTPEKIQRAQEIALRLSLPVVYLVDCSGLYLPEQSRSFAGARGAGHIFKKNSQLSAAGVPQIAGVFGDCIAGGGYMPIISDRVYMTEQAYMVIAGAALIKGAKSQAITSLDIGGPEVHVHQSGCADVRVPDDQTLIECIRRELATLPTSAANYYRGEGASIEPSFASAELTQLIPHDHRHAYRAEEVLARLCDQSLFWEFYPEHGLEVICGVGKVAGLYAGFVINRQGLVAHADRPLEQRPAGTLYREGIAKISAFSRACNDDGIPLVWLQDISGFDIGLEAEREGLLGLGSSLIYTNSTNQTPMFSVLLRKASGAGYYAMSGLPYDPVVQLSTPSSRLSVMEGRTLAIAAYNSRLDDDFEIETEDPTERAEIEKGMQEVEARIETDMDPYRSASRMDTDEVISLEELRPWLCALLEMSYQATGVRRIKNPRIWSLHDLALLRESKRGATESSESREEVKGSVPKAKKKARSGEFIAALSAGRFYQRPAPDQPAFVKVGDMIQPGQVVGLVEVMKTFSRVLYEGDQLLKVASILPDGSEVQAGDVLLELA